jgi:hypothetical protein
VVAALALANRRHSRVSYRVLAASLVSGLTAWRVLSMRSAGAWAVRFGTPLAALLAADLAIVLDLAAAH